MAVDGNWDELNTCMLRFIALMLSACTAKLLNCQAYYPITITNSCTVFVPQWCFLMLFIPPCSLLLTELCTYRSFCHEALVIKASAPAKSTRESQSAFQTGDFTPLDVICSDKPAEAILQLQSEQR